ncbi:MAG: glutamate--tRNA ligase [Deltaproteobacteria bacterium]|nr:glutamate--tRNA ligase [Deltaproteobacteria bacterium]
MESNKSPVTRFAPSPTGYLHIGGARTALFNWLHARHCKGKFILRIEDTDTRRSTKESVDAIFEAMKWLEMDWDEGPYFQSKRINIYREYIRKLIDENKAYYCTCTSEQVEAMRKKAMATGGKPKYDGTCREKGLGPSKGAVVRFRAPIAGTTVVRDEIRGNISFDNSEIDDFIIQRSDGMPTYNLAVVVDDLTMGVNMIIRGDDHISNTPKQILLYEAFGADMPEFGHVPMVLGHDKARLSKRHGAMSVTAYREMGFHPDALLNYLVRLGWSHGDQEFFTRNDLIEKFDISHVGKSAGVFNPEKLLAINAEHIRATTEDELAVHLIPFLEERGIKAEAGPFLNSVIKTLKPRSKTFIEMADSAVFYFIPPETYEEKGVKKFFKPGAADLIDRTCAGIENVEPFDKPGLEDVFTDIMEKSELKFGKVAQPVRLALSGKTVSPGIFEMIEALGKAETVARLKNAADFIRKQQF